MGVRCEDADSVATLFALARKPPDMEVNLAATQIDAAVICYRERLTIH
jgi:hypothetical protein